MRLRVKRTKQAERDLIEAYKFIAADSPEAAERFLDAARRTFEFLAGAPRVGRPVHVKKQRLRGMRRWSIAGFRVHLVFYRPQPRVLAIVRVLHGARDTERIISAWTR